MTAKEHAQLQAIVSAAQAEIVAEELRSAGIEERLIADYIHQEIHPEY